MDIGISNIVPIIAQSTTDYLAEYAPLFLLIAGLVLAIGIIFKIVGFIPGGDTESNDDDDNYRRKSGDWI